MKILRLSNFNYLLIVNCILLLGCIKKTEGSVKEIKYFELEVFFEPAFSNKSKLLIVKKDSTRGFKFIIYKLNKMPNEIWYEETCAISDSDFKMLKEKINNLHSIDIKKEKRLGTDGVFLNVNFMDGSVKKKFEFWSPGREKEKVVYENLIDPLFNLMFKYFKNRDHVNYIEQLEQYFDFGIPIKKVSNNPLEYKIYGSLSANERTEVELDLFIDSIPFNKPLLLDMSNFISMGTRLYPKFKKLIAKNSKIIWVASDEAKVHLKEIGVGNERIFQNRDEAIKFIMY